MDNLEQNSLANRLLTILRDWINKIIPEETKNCLRTKIGYVIESDDETHYGTFRVILQDDFNKYKTLKSDLDNGKIDSDTFNDEVNDFCLNSVPCACLDLRDHMFPQSVVTIAYTDNKLSNAFILFRNNIYNR